MLINYDIYIFFNFNISECRAKESRQLRTMARIRSTERRSLIITKVFFYVFKIQTSRRIENRESQPQMVLAFHLHGECFRRCSLFYEKVQGTESYLILVLLKIFSENVHDHDESNSWSISLGARHDRHLYPFCRRLERLCQGFELTIFPALQVFQNNVKRMTMYIWGILLFGLPPLIWGAWEHHEELLKYMNSQGYRRTIAGYPRAIVIYGFILCFGEV